MGKKEDMYRYAAKPNKGSSILHPAMAGVYYDFGEKRAVSTDGYILRISKAAYDALSDDMKNNVHLLHKCDMIK